MDNKMRGAEIERRRLALGIKSGREFSKKAEVARNTLDAVKEGTASPETYARLEAWLDRFEEETGHADADDLGIIEFEVSGDFGVRVVVRGPVHDAEALEQSVTRIVHSIRAEQDPSPK